MKFRFESEMKIVAEFSNGREIEFSLDDRHIEHIRVTADDTLIVAPRASNSVHLSQTRFPSK